MNYPHFHITATADDGARAEHQSGAYLPALALARRLVQEARLAGGTVTYGGGAVFTGLWLVRDGQGTPTATVAVSDACFGEHAAMEVPARVAA